MASPSKCQTHEMQRQEDTEDEESIATRSRCSSAKSSRHSSRSSASAAIRARARAEAAQAELSYAAKEASLLKEKARIAADSACKEAELQAELHVLKMERKAAAASAEAEMLEAAIEGEEKQSCKDENIPIACYSPAERTSEYVQGLAHAQSSQESLVTGHLDGLNDTSESKIPLCCRISAY